jgi:HSP20 family protein
MLTMDLLSEMNRMQQELNRLFEGPRQSADPQTPAMNVWTSETGAEITAELPGIEPASLDISVHDQTLSLKGRRDNAEPANEAQWVRRERASGEFARTVKLPFRVNPDKVEARYAKGVLSITLPRAESELPKKLPVKAA